MNALLVWRKEPLSFCRNPAETEAGIIGNIHGGNSCLANQFLNFYHIVWYKLIIKCFINYCYLSLLLLEVYVLCMSGLQ